jgi:hypothetical protein
MKDKELRLKLYERQKKLLRLKDGYESVCLPGQLIRTNPRIFNDKG